MGASVRACVSVLFVAVSEGFYQQPLSLTLHYVPSLYLIILSFSGTFPELSSQLVMRYLAPFKRFSESCV